MANEYVRVAPSGGAKLVDINPNKSTSTYTINVWYAASVASIPVCGYSKVALKVGSNYGSASVQFLDKNGNVVGSAGYPSSWTDYTIPNDATILKITLSTSSAANQAIIAYALYV